jgi:gentisate 1,2-dioxygenase
MSKPDSSLVDSLAAVHLQPLWDRYMKLVSREPRSPVGAMLWKGSTLHELAARAVTEVPMEDAERRVLLLTHPDFGGEVVTTHNLSGGIQILQPGERAAAHRHTLTALRFVMTGSGAVTIVDGKRCPMEPGDLIMTPSWTWHEHVNEGSEQVVWFDGLDLPLARSLDSVFFQMGEPKADAESLVAVDDAVFEAGAEIPAGRLPAGGYSPQFRYSWRHALQRLAAMEGEADGTKLLQYRNPVNGAAVTPTLDCYLLELPQKRRTFKRRSTANTVCVVAEGSGTTTAGAQTFHWQKGDVFTLPHWSWVSHEADTQARVFLMTDRELLNRLGYLREEVSQVAAEPALA